MNDLVPNSQVNTAAGGYTPCGLGYYSSSTGATVCSASPAGQFASISGNSASSAATGTTPCAAGSYSLAASSSCTLAPAGTSVGSTGLSVATPCASGTYSSGTGKTGACCLFVYCACVCVCVVYLCVCKIINRVAFFFKLLSIA